MKKANLMSSLSYRVMNSSDEISKAFRAEQNYDAANDASCIESLVNNIYHGLYDVEWVPRFFEICESHPFKDTEGFSKAFDAAVAIIKADGHETRQE